MAEEYCGVNWWESSTTNRSRFDGGGGGGGGGGLSSSSTTTTLANSGGGGPGYGWLADGLGLSSQAMAEWNQEQQTRHAILNPEKVDNGFRSMLQEGMGLNTNFQPDPTGGGGGGGPGVIFGGNNSPQIHQWRPEKLFPNNEESNPEFKQMNRGFSLDNQHQFSPSTGSSIESTVTCQGLTTPSNFQLDCSSTNSVFGSPSSILQGLLGTEQQQQHAQPQPQPPQQFGANNYHQQNYFGLGVSNDHHNHQQQQQQHESQLPSSWAKVPQFLRDSSPKQHQQQQQQQQRQQLHFINNGPYWSGSTPLNEVRPNFFSPLQAAQLPNMPTFEAKPKTTMEVRNTSSMVKKSGPENNSKRSRNDGTSSTLPPFKVRKEKMGDRITALQQLVSPFGKTDTASVLSEAIEYIKFLHEQVSVLSDPYLKSGGSYQQNQPGNEKAKIDPDGPKQDLRSRGLCLVPVSSTFPVTHETTVDFWTPTFGGTFR